MVKRKKHTLLINSNSNLPLSTRRSRRSRRSSRRSTKPKHISQLNLPSSVRSLDPRFHRNTESLSKLFLKTLKPKNIFKGITAFPGAPLAVAVATPFVITVATIAATAESVRYGIGRGKDKKNAKIINQEAIKHIFNEYFSKIKIRTLDGNIIIIDNTILKNFKNYKIIPKGSSYSLILDDDDVIFVDDIKENIINNKENGFTDDKFYLTDAKGEKIFYIKISELKTNNVFNIVYDALPENFVNKCSIHNNDECEICVKKYNKKKKTQCVYNKRTKKCFHSKKPNVRKDYSSFISNC